MSSRGPRSKSEIFDQNRDLPVDRRSKTHLYLQTFQYLRDQIYNGSYQDGQPLPSENELINQFKISRITARRTVDELVAAGLASRGRGRRTLVCYRGYRQPMQAPIEEFLDSVYVLGKSTSVQLLGFEYTTPSEEVMQKLRIAPGELVQQAVRIRSVGRKPLLHVTSYVPERIGRLFTERDLATKPLNELLRNAGIRIKSAEQNVGATLALVDTAGLLKIQAGAALIRIRRVLFDDTGSAVEYAVILGDGDAFEFTMAMAPKPER